MNGDWYECFMECTPFDVLLKGSNRFCSSLCFVAFALAFIGMLLVHSSFPLYFVLAHCPARTSLL